MTDEEKYEFVILVEMTSNFGPPTNFLQFDNQHKILFKSSKKLPVVASFGDYKLHRDDSVENATAYVTNNHKKKETAHAAQFKTFGPTKQVPVTHIKQIFVEKSDSNLPKEYASKLTYDHFKSQEHPLVTSDTQYTPGYKSWKKLLHWALVDGHHVYYHDGETLHKSSKETVDEHHKDSYGASSKDKSEKTMLKKMIISKRPLK